MRSTDSRSRKERCVNFDKSDRSGLDRVARSLDLLQWLRNIENNALRLRAESNVGQRLPYNREDFSYLGLMFLVLATPRRLLSDPPFLYPVPEPGAGP